eukprot:704755-Rhodomonas_salina.2
MDLPRLPVSVLEDDPKALVAAMEQHGLVVLTSIGEGTCQQLWLSSTLESDHMLTGKGLHAELMSKFKDFCALSDEEKAKATSSKVYRSERGVPMWHCGLEPGHPRALALAECYARH